MFVDKTLKDKQDIDRMVTEGSHDLKVEAYATLSAIRGRQFGREIFSSMLKFGDLLKFLEVFPSVQRQASTIKIGRIKTYVQSGLENKELMRFFSSLTVSCSGHLFFDETTNKIAIDISKSRLSVNDGQHRMFSISAIIEEMERKALHARDKEVRVKYRKLLDELKEMSIPVVIFNQITQKEEKQLFHDLNNLASRPSRSANIRLNQVDLIAKLSRELATNNYFLSRVGVESDKGSIHHSNPNLVLLTTIYTMIKELYWKDYIKDNQFITEMNYDYYYKELDETLNEIFRNLPNDVHVKGKYLIEKNYSLKGIARFIHTCKVRMKVEDDNIIFEAIKKVDWTPNYTKWSLYGGTKSSKGNLLFSGGEGGINAVQDMLLDTIKFTDHKQTLEELQNDSKAI